MEIIAAQTQGFAVAPASIELKRRHKDKQACEHACQQRASRRVERRQDHTDRLQHPLP